MFIGPLLSWHLNLFRRGLGAECTGALVKDDAYRACLSIAPCKTLFQSVSRPASDLQGQVRMGRLHWWYYLSVVLNTTLILFELTKINVENRHLEQPIAREL
jgi:hypothetical protein